MRVAAVREHIQPMAVGILAGSVVGLCLAIPGLMATGYVRHRMYYFVACMLTESINTCALAACITAYVFHIGRMLKGWLSLLVCLLAAIGFLGFVGARLGLGHRLSYIFRDVNADYAKAFFLQGFPQIIACVILIIAGIILMRRMRRVRSIEVVTEETTVPESRTETPVSHSNTALNHPAYLSVVVLVAFLGLNSLPAVLRAKNAYDLRKAPNVIYIMVDTLRADHLGCYGYPRNTSPNIDKFAAQSMRFDKAISQAPWTTASIASFMSSRYLRVLMNPLSARIPSSVVLMPDMLKNLGYETAAVISNPLAGRASLLDRGYDHYYEMPEDKTTTIQGKQTVPPTVVSKSIGMLRQMKNRRFFLFAHFMGPHSPYASHKEYAFFPSYKGKLSREGVFVEGCHWSGDDLKYTMALYDGEIAYTDQYIGLLLAELKKANIYDNTLIVILSDHGEEFEEHGKLSHGEHLYDETIHVPLIVKLPGQKTGDIVNGAFPLVNLLPSITNFIHCDTTALGFQGTGVPLKGLQRVRQSNIYSSTDFHNNSLQSLRRETGKLIADNISHKEEFYDLVNDPGEKRNIAADSQQTAAAFESELRSVNERIDAALPHNVEKPLRPEEAQAMKKSMRALGYVQ